jgi:hypothetical protein
MSNRAIVILLFLTVLGILVLSATKSHSAERSAASEEWGWTPDRPNQWCKEFLPTAGDFRICAEYGHGREPLYIHQRRCANGRFGFVAWRSDSSSSSGLCDLKEFRGGVRELERMAGPLPRELLEELRKPSPRERARKK